MSEESNCKECLDNNPQKECSGCEIPSGSIKNIEDLFLERNAFDLS